MYDEAPIADQARYLRNVTSMDQAQDYYNQGIFSQVQWEAYCYAWRRAAIRYSSAAAGYEEPYDEQVRELGDAILGLLGLPPGYNANADDQGLKADRGSTLR